MREPPAHSFQPPTPAASLREDVVVSACFSDVPATPRAFEIIRTLAATLDTQYRFREIIVVVEDNAREAFLPLVEQVPDLRLFVVRKGTEYYQRRVIAAEEAIGDLVLIGHIEEVARMDVLAFLARAESSNAIAIANNFAKRPVKDLIAWPFRALGRLAGFRVDPSDFQTIAMPRTLLNPILAHDEPRLALRYPPRDPRLPVAAFRVEDNIPSRSALRDIGRRAQLFQTLLVYLTPIILSAVAISSSILTLVGLAYAAWIVGAVIVVEKLANGWLTTNAMLAMSAVFMGVSTLGLSLGLQHLLRLQSRDQTGDVPEEVNRIDLFGKVASDLNVEHESATPAAEAIPAKGDG
ncbi:MAG: hypothetical protein AAFP79_06965 [Pseudomonadota bacterium]